MQPRHAAIWGFLGVVIGAAGTAQAQHHDERPDTATEAHETTASPQPEMPSLSVLGLPISRHGSGTAWLPDTSPMRAFHARLASWDVMVHANVFVGYDHQGSDAGDGQVVSQNWLMAMAAHSLAGGVFEARAMLSLEPVTVGEDGYPLLLQTGETSDGAPLVDRQHPHDLFMELAARYARELNDDLAFEVYTALAGEPAVGPVAYPHRPSAMADPFAPISHHWLDSTHISFGVLTAGVFTRTAKLEASWFNGREPDEGRLDFDLRTPDSYATRLSVNPSREWSLQGSYAYLDSPEGLEPEVAIHRVTASATNTVRVGQGHWSSTAAFGHNHPTSERMTTAFLVETAIEHPPYGLTFARAEYVQKTGHDFALPESMEDVSLPVTALSLGHVHEVATVAGAETALGIRGSVGYIDADLEGRYGTRWPLGVMAYVQLQPAQMPSHASH
jgi:hypothetical protein